MNKPSTITTNEQAYRDGTLSQPSAPTADVKKLITKEGALAYFKQFLNGDTGMASAEVLADVMLTVQHQVRAPLEKRIGILERAIERRNIALDDANKRNRELVQVSAPLVELLRRAFVKGHGDRWCFALNGSGLSEEEQAILTAAITGTGEISRVKEGETTTTQKGEINKKVTSLDKPITDPVTYRKPIAALHNGREVKLLAHGNQEGKSPVFQYCDETTGQVGWESQSQFRIIDSSIMPGSAVRKIWSEFQSGQGQNQNPR